MRTILFVAGMAFAASLFAQAHGDKEAREDAKRHRELARLHEAAAKCIESGRPAKDCHEQLRKDCKGAGIGKYCGMRHQH